MTQLNLQNVLEKVEFNLNQVKCTWGDGHEGVFTENWLFDRRFTTDNINYLKTGLRDDPILVESSHKLHTANFNVTMHYLLIVLEIKYIHNLVNHAHEFYSKF